ncbi:transposase [Streptomyces sp. 6N223]|uniref:transposase n=1 Tax=Streptomyces sp. 6N223 TaxID=3457412 RepID=UPI003FD0C970
MPVPRPARRARRPEGPPDRRPALGPPLQDRPGLLADHEDEIELHFLPSYSPELNPDELVNSDLKRSLPHAHRARNQAELAAETRRFFHRRQRQPHVITGYFKALHVRYTLDE